jgi:hypothetical protein
MGYRSEDGSRPRVGSGRQGDWSAGTGGADDYDYDRYGPDSLVSGTYGSDAHAPRSHSSGGQAWHRPPQHAGPQHADQWHGDVGHDTDWRAGSHRGGSRDEWYPEEHGNLTDPYGIQGPGTGRDPVRGYPPAPEFYEGEGYQRFDQPGYDQPGYEEPGYDQAGYDQAGYDEPGYGNDDDLGRPDPFQRDPAYQGPYEDSGDPFGGNPYENRGSRPRRRTRRRRVSRPMLLSITAGTVVIALAVAGYVLVFGKANSEAAAPAGSPSGRVQAPAGPTSSASAACAARLGTYCHIETRVLDPLPLSLAEVFRAQFMNTSNGSAFAEAGSRVDTNCASAIIGSPLQAAIKTGKCTQVLRASYVSGNGQIMGTIGVVNLDTTQDAAKAGKAVDGNDFINPLTTKSGVTSKLGNGTGVVEAEYKGHYLILTWAEFTNLKTPDSHQSHVLEQFETDLVAGTINVSLSERMVTGKPATAS